MSNLSEHRIYKYLSEPVRILGFTVDEIAVMFGGFVGFMTLEWDPLWKSSLLIGGIGGAFVLRKFKKQKVGLSFLSFLYWHGFMKSPSKEYPRSENRFFLP
jgi:type IV conjugative transfer system protein TraL